MCAIVKYMYSSQENELIFKSVLFLGYISMEEFSEACDLLGQHLSSPIPRQQIIEMAKSMDMNKDGYIDLNEFLETFRIVSTENEHDDSIEYEELDEWCSNGSWASFLLSFWAGNKYITFRISFYV